MSGVGFIPQYVVATLAAVAPEDCPYCLVRPELPCVLHRAASQVEK